MTTKAKPRYYFSYVKGDGYRIHDRGLKLHVAHCNFRECAFLITCALNAQEERLVAERYQPTSLEGTD